MASTPRSRGNALFKASDFVGAAAAYTEGISTQLSEQVSKLQQSFASLGLTSGSARNGSAEGACRRRVASGSSSDSSCTAIVHSAGDNAVLIQAAKASDAEEQTLLLSNRAACHLETGNLAAAAADALAALTLAPCNPKAYFRLARALPRDDPAAAPVVAAAVVLQPPGQRGESLGSLYAEVRQAGHAEHAAVHAMVEASGLSRAAVDDGTYTSTGAVVRLQLPGDLALITCVGSALELDMALRRRAEVVVLRPGAAYYSAAAFSDCRHSFSLVGLGPGGVELRAQGPSHALWLMQPAHVTLVNLRLRGGGHGAAACLSDPGAVLQLSRCRVEDYPEVAVLVVGGRAKMDCCTFTRTAKQAVEVREGGELLARQLTITDCHQGLSAYGGARLLLLQDCTIQRCRKEGVLIAGNFSNAATDMQAMLLHFRKPQGAPPDSTVGREVSKAAHAWGKQMGIALTAVLLGCTIRGCGQFGVSADTGARVIIQGCLLEANDPFSAYIKGGTDAIIAACQLHYSGAKSKSSWQGNGPKARQTGIEVAVNYHGCVEVVGNAFVGPEELAISELSTADNALKAKIGSKAMGIWSRPVIAQRNSHHDPSDCAHLPSLESLVDTLPTRLRIHGGGATGSDAPDGGTNAGGQALPNVLRPSQGAGARPGAAAPAVSALQRPCSVFAQAAWSPTGHEFYAIGNTLGYDVTAGQGHAAAAASPRGEVRVLLGACGDVRNLLATVHAAMSTSEDAPGRPRPCIACVMNDGNISMLARNAALLHMAGVLGAPADAVLAVWACHGLSTAHRQLLDASLAQLAEEPWPEWLSASASLDSRGASSGGHAAGVAARGGGCARGVGGGGDAERALRAVFAAWAGCMMPLKQVLALRRDMLGATEASDGSLALSLLAARASLGPAASVVDAGKLRREVAAYVRTGSLQAEGQPLEAANPTFLLAPELQYTVYFSSSIFRALPLTSHKGAPSAKAMLLATLGPQLQSVVEALKEGRLQIRLVCGDILAALLAPPLSPEPSAAGAVEPESYLSAADSSNVEAGSGTPPPQAADDRYGDQQGSELREPLLFDFIDASNVADYVSLPSLVQGALPLLRPAPHARLHAESIVLHVRDSMGNVGMDPRGFVAKRLGMPLQDFEALLGVGMGVCERMAEQEGVRMQWQPRPASGKEERMAQGTQQQGGMQELLGSLSRLRLSEESLLEKLRPAFRRFVSSFISSPAAAWGGEGTPLTLVHLLSLVAPQEAEGLLRQLLAEDSASSSSGSGSGSSGGGHAGLFKWELIMHAQVQAGKRPALRRVRYAAQPGVSMVMYSQRPLLLAVSKEELKRDGVTAPPAVKQLVSAFAWDEAMAVAHVLLPESILEQCGAWRLTLCALSEHVGLVVVGASSRIDRLPSEAVAAGPWRCMPPT
eukprot:jgi/Mesvir1/15930/Mv08253-RA.1